jgi:aminoglycoside 3-N-acetyltransferase
VVLDGTPQTVLIAETDHCCRRFALADEWLRAARLQHEGPVGHAHARLIDSRAVVETTVERLRRDPLLFLCDPADGCDECDAARASL